MMKKFPIKISRLLGHLGRQSCKYQKIVQHMTFTYKDWTRYYHLPCKDIVLQVHTLTGATPPPSLSIQFKGNVPHGGESQAWLNSKVLLSCATDSYIKYSTKKARPRECQESDFVLKNVLPDSRGNVCPMNASAIKKYFAKKSVSVDWKPERVVQAKVRDIKKEKAR
jgi:hypothetical protein